MAHCCPTKVLPVESDYKPLFDRVYIAGASNGSTKGILLVPDIFGGDHPNAFHVADILAGKGFLVVIPDYFRGKAWDVNDFPPKKGFESPEFQEFFGSLKYELLKERTEQGIKILKALGADTVGALGLCWGAMMAANALIEGSLQSVAMAHPSLVTPEMMSNIKGPILIMPSMDDGDYLQQKTAAEGTGHKVGYRYFHDIHHGFLAARADFNDEANRERANEAIDLTVDFFNETL